jgi:uncharacterized metal-binding protein
MAVLVLFLIKPLETAFLVSYGCLIGIVVTPDLDVETGNYGFHVMRTLFGDFVGTLWKYYWWPYGKVIPHRSWISHFPGVSTLFRFLYLSWPVFLVLWTINQEIRLNIWLLWVFLGMALVDALHIILDILSSFIKRSLMFL